MNTPTISALVPLYTEGPGALSKAKAVQFIVSYRLRAHNAKGKGTKAEKRRWGIVNAKLFAVGEEVKALNARIAKNRAQWHADELAELRSARTISHHHRANFKG